jgi:type I restriction enzyme S subunit
MRFFFETIIQQNLSISYGTAIPNLSAKQIKETAFPLPPLAEQHRIVTKVDELMALCDELEAAQAKREKRRDRVGAATLHGLNNGRDSSPSRPTVSSNGAFGETALPDFHATALFFLKHLPRLTAKPEHIQQLRQTILNLAVRGKLVPQNPNDEPALKLIQRIYEEKQLLVRQRRLRSQGFVEPVEETEKPFELPNGWEWERAGSLFLNVTDGFHNTPLPTKAGFKYITASHIRPGKIDFDSCLHVDEENHKELFSKTKVKRGDILVVNIGAGCGTPAIVEVDFQFSFKNVAVINLPSELNRKYVLLFLLYYQNLVFDELIKGGAQPFLGLGMLRQLLVPVPPLAEQKGIVARVNELMTVCDEMEDRLTTSANTRHQLLEATLHEALASDLGRGIDVRDSRMQ